MFLSIMITCKAIFEVRESYSLIPLTSFSPDLANATFIIFPKLKNVSGCITSLKSTLIRHQSKVCLIQHTKTHFRNRFKH